jgi:predicted alpha/beta-hydrolase family hydrolase
LPVTFAVDDTERVSALLQSSPDARACYVFAHGAGAGMTHPFMTALANELAARGIATLRYQFPYMEKRSKRPDSTQGRAGSRARGRLPKLRSGCRAWHWSRVASRLAAA